MAREKSRSVTGRGLSAVRASNEQLTELNNKLLTTLKSIRELCYNYLADCKRCSHFRGIVAGDICDDEECLARTACCILKTIVEYIERRV